MSTLPSKSESVSSQVTPQVNLLDTGRLHLAPANGDGVDQLFGDCWEWTTSSYSSYPGYKAPPGALGEYNGKFMFRSDVLARRVLRYTCGSCTCYLSKFL